MKMLLKVSYTDDTGKFWQDSYLKNEVVTIDETKDIHVQIAEIIRETDGVVLTYNAKPQGNVYIDTKNDEAKRIGYIYRGKTDIYDDAGRAPARALFDVWVSISEVVDYGVEDIES